MKRTSIASRTLSSDAEKPFSPDTVVWKQPTTPHLDTSEHISMEFVFRPTATTTSAVRRFVMDMCSTIVGEPERTSRVGLATHELLENAVKYGVAGEATIVNVEMDRNSGLVRVGVENRSVERNARAVEERVRELNAADDVFEFYQSLLRATANDMERSGLGLARICCEGDMKLDVELDRDRLRITAVTRPEAAA